MDDVLKAAWQWREFAIALRARISHPAECGPHVAAVFLVAEAADDIADKMQKSIIMDELAEQAQELKMGY